MIEFFVTPQSVPSLLWVGGWLLLILGGLSIGATAIGGVLVVPALTALMGHSLPTAIAVSSLSFLATGIWALASTKRWGLETLRSEKHLMLAALLGAIAGASLTPWIPAFWVRTWVGILALTSGLYGLWRARSAPLTGDVRGWLHQGSQWFLGLVVGAGSALSGTGGPVLLVPWLLLTHRPLERSVAVAQVIQVPIAFAATAAHFSAGRIDWELSAKVTLALLVGMVIGRSLAKRLPLRPLQIATAVLLVATGSWFLIH